VTTAGPTLADAKRRAATDHVLTATRRYVLAHGLDASMDQLAEAAGVSRRTLFRMFGSREALIAEGFAVAIDAFGRELPSYTGDLPGWVRALCNHAHQRNAAAGPGYWEFTTRSDLPPDIAAQQDQRRRDSRRRMRSLTTTLWRAADGTGDPPSLLVTELSTFLSAHFTAAVLNDGHGRWQDAADLATEGVLAALHRHRGSSPASS
jgi:AcrR family transcriptional regulator